MGGLMSKTRETHDVMKYDDDLIMSREEQYEWLMFLIKASKKEIIKHMERNPRKATAPMRFDFLGSCDCSYYAKCCTGKNGGKDLLLLQRCVRYGLCPHILLLRHGYSEDNPLFYTDELFEQLYSNKDLDTTERSTPNYSGLYWIHVVIITRKFDAVVEPFSFLNHAFFATLDLYFNPLHLAILHNEFSWIKPLVRCNIYFLNHSVKLTKEEWTLRVSAKVSLTEFLVLKNKVSALKIILPLFKKLSCKRWEEFYNALNISIEMNKPGGKDGKFMDKAQQANDIDCVNVLCKYICLDSEILENSLIKAISEENLDVCDILITNMRKSLLDFGKILFRAILGRNSKCVSSLLKNKSFDVSKYRDINMLKWAEILKLPEIYDMLKAAGCVKDQTDRSGCPIKIVISWSINTLVNIKVLIEESGFDPNGKSVHNTCTRSRILPPVYHALLRYHQFEVVKYLLLNGASLKLDEETQQIFVKRELREINYDVWHKFILILVETNAQFLAHVNKTMLFSIIDSNAVLFNILYRISHTIPPSLMQNLEEYELACDATEPRPYQQNEIVNRRRNEIYTRLNIKRNAIIKALLYQPVTLQMACRNTFRRHCGLKFSAMISSLEEIVPSKITDFLKFNDVVDEISELPFNHRPSRFHCCGDCIHFKS